QTLPPSVDFGQSHTPKLAASATGDGNCSFHDQSTYANSLRFRTVRHSLTRAAACAGGSPASGAGAVSSGLDSLPPASFSRNCTASCFSVSVGARPSAICHTRSTHAFWSELPHSFTIRPANSCAWRKGVRLFRNQSACGATVVTSRTGQLTEFTG